MEWSFEKTVMFVDTIRQYPILYDGTVDYRKKEFAWRLIAKRLEHTGFLDILKLKWTSLKREFIQSIKSPSPTSFALASYMSYLFPFVMPDKKETDWLNNFEYLVKLISLVREHPCLYNRKNWASRAAIWEEIAINMNDGTTGMRCQTRWLKLRNKFTDCLRTGIPMKPKGIGTHLNFLKAYLKMLPPPQRPPVKETAEVKFLKKLIDVVRGYPILYDGTKFKPTVFNPTWQKVAETLGNGATATDCRYRWRKLRKNYKCHLKLHSHRLTYPGLHKRLGFLKQYVMFKRPAEETHLTEQQRKDRLLDAFGRQFKALLIDDRDRDTMFLMNFMHDMANMDEVQVRRFRIGALKAAREILDQGSTG